MKFILIIAQLNIIDYLGMIFIISIVLLILYVLISDKFSESDRRVKDIQIETEINNRKALRKTFTRARDEVYINTELRGPAAYYKSSQWKETKRSILLKRGNRCEKCGVFICNQYDLHLHHLTYEDFYNEYEEDLMLLCKPCHEKIHNKKFKVVDLKNELEILKTLLNVIITDFENFNHFNERDMDKMRDWLKDNLQYLNLDNHPFYKMRQLLLKVTQREMVIYIEDLLKLNSICFSISVNFHK